MHTPESEPLKAPDPLQADAPSREAIRFAAALEGVERDLRALAAAGGLRALRPPIQHFARQARAAGASHSQIVTALGECLKERSLVPTDAESDHRARAQVIRWAIEAYYLAD
jgi:hypothetical protein